MPYFNRNSSETRGAVVLVVVIVVLCGVGFWGMKDEGMREKLMGTDSVENKKREVRYYAQPQREVETFPFDPNTADSTTLLRLGLTPSMVRGIYKYRAMGYVYSYPEDFSRVPGMTNEMWERLHPMIRIDKRFQLVTPQPRPKQQPLNTRDSTYHAWRDSIHSDGTLRQGKLKRGETLEVNAADTTQLKMVPCIGSYFAQQIVMRRERLGGFYCIEQLDEIEGFPLEALPYLTIDTTQVRRIDVNHCTKNNLIRHPYLRAIRGKAIWEYRHNYGSLRSLNDLRRLPDFAEEDVQRLAPYLLFRP